MTTETNAEQLRIIKETLDTLERNTILYFNTGLDHLFDQVTDAKRAVVDCVEGLQAENARLRKASEEQSSTVHVIKRRNGKPTIIGWNGERYVYQSESSARGGYANGKRKTT